MTMTSFRRHVTLLLSLLKQGNLVIIETEIFLYSDFGNAFQPFGFFFATDETVHFTAQPDKL